ncbi:MAG TPA: hypothetical protein VN752_09265 [Solirubrobacterales bacterium]|nr:hypothetical protein [Solirubrobacterales bacterium]
MRAKTIMFAATAFVAFALAGPTSALAAPVLGIDTDHVPASVPSGTHVKYTIAVSNTGDAPTTEPVTVNFSVPAGLEIVSVSSEAAFGFNLWDCSTSGGGDEVECDGPVVVFEPGVEFPLEIAPGTEACVENFGQTCRIMVVAKVTAAPGTVTPTATVCGGGVTTCPTAGASVSDPTDVGPPPEFEIESFDGRVLDDLGDPATQAGSHPHIAATEFSFTTFLGADGFEYQADDLQDAIVELPPGLVGNPQALASCTQAQVVDDNCPPGSQVGEVVLHFNGGTINHPRHGVFNMEVPHGTPALFAFRESGVVVQLYARVRTGEDYGVTVISKNAPQTLPVHGVDFVFWGVPADPSHDPDRSCENNAQLGCSSTEPLMPFITLPTSCVGPGSNNSVETRLTATGWHGGEALASFFSHDNNEPPEPIGTIGCNSLEFTPSLEARPTTNVADAPSGLEVTLHIPQNDANEPCDPGPPVSCGTAQAHLKDTTVTLPEGLVVNPSAANGLDGCSLSEFGFTSKEGDVIHTTPDAATCPDASKLGNVEVESPLVDHPLKGSVHIADPYQNPFNSLIAIYITLDDPATGTVVKLAGEVHADPNTGQLTSTVLHNPQLPFEDFKLHFFGGAGGPLRTPAVCGQYQATSSLTPWSAPESGPPDTPSDTWAISQAPDGGVCPASQGARPNTPDLDAGSVSPIAGASTPMVVNLRRNDGSQEFSSVSLTLPPGLTGKLAGLGSCPEGALAAASSKTGNEEKSSPSCPASSRIGVVDVAAGAGPAPYHAQGIAYLTGPYKGGPLGMAIVTPATAGPFDLGTVVVRSALQLDPATGRITAQTDQLPSILQGIPLDLREARVLLDRPDFTRNGTSCDPLAFSGQLVSTLAQTASLSERFQLGECGRLAFKPKLAIRLIGGTKRGAHPALKATLTMPPGGANIDRVSVALPRSEFLDQAHIGTVCTRVQFAADACPAASVYGQATATSPLVDYTLSGPAILRSSNNELPDLVISLRGPAHQPVGIDAAARIDSINGRIRSTFEGVPDLPVSTFTLSMAGGKKGLLQNSTNICKGKHKATAEFDGQNGKVADLKPLLKNSKCSPQKRKAKKQKRRARRAAR